MKTIFSLLQIALLSFTSILVLVSNVAAKNFILILTDDQGWTGTSVKMDKRARKSSSDLYLTPSLERFAAQGMVFSNGYAPAPNCSPTRMSIQTGKSPARLGATDIIDVVPTKDNPTPIMYRGAYVNKPSIIPLPISNLAQEEITIAEFIKSYDASYATAHFGKWHMGDESPTLHGYDQHDGSTTNDPGSVGMPDPKRTTEVTNRALSFLDEVAKNNKPFFMQVSYYAVHGPTRANPDTISRYAKKIPNSNATHTNVPYAAMTEELDTGLGQILDKLEELELDDDTYFIYTSDNGGESYTSNNPLARGKTHVWEGGIRVPFIFRGPGITGGKQSNVPIIAYDLFPTIAEWLGFSNKLPEDMDGGSLVTVLENEGIGAVKRATEPMVWYYSAYRNGKHVSPQAAIRIGDHKLIRYFDTGQNLLFDLSLDLSETTDLSRFRPAQAKKLSAALDAYLDEVDAKLPVINKNYDPVKDPGFNRYRSR